MGSGWSPGSWDRDYVDDGTMCRIPSPTPRPLGTQRRVSDEELIRRWLDGMSDLNTTGTIAYNLITYHDATRRLQYKDAAQRVSQRILLDYEAGRIPDHMAARLQANQARIGLLEDTRAKLSPGGRELSKAIAEEGKTLLVLEPKYAAEILAAKHLAEDPQLALKHGLKSVQPGSPGFDQEAYRKVVQKLATTEFSKPEYHAAIKQLQQTEDVSKAIISASGRTNKVLTGFARFSRIAGPVGSAVSLTVSGYEVYDAPEGEKLYVVGRETAGFTGGLVGASLGGLAAGWVASLACGPAAPICAVVVSIVIIGGAAWGMGALFEEGYEELLRSTRVPATCPGNCHLPVQIRKPR
jgi:hypothetical protein